MHIAAKYFEVWFNNFSVLGESIFSSTLQIRILNWSFQQKIPWQVARLQNLLNWTVKWGEMGLDENWDLAVLKSSSSLYVNSWRWTISIINYLYHCLQHFLRSKGSGNYNDHPGLFIPLARCLFNCLSVISVIYFFCTRGTGTFNHFQAIWQWKPREI